MDQDETTSENTFEEPTLTETKAEEAEGHEGEEPGKVIQTFLVRITLRLNPGDGDAEVERAEAAVPTNDRLADLIGALLYEHVHYFHFDSIHVQGEKV